jgi:hypothetical protein
MHRCSNRQGLTDVPTLEARTPWCEMCIRFGRVAPPVVSSLGLSADVVAGAKVTTSARSSTTLVAWSASARANVSVNARCSSRLIAFNFLGRFSVIMSTLSSTW